MDQSFHLSRYFRQLGRQWKLIIIPALIAVVAAIIFSWLIPVRYTARTTLVAPKPKLAWRWDNKVYDIVDVRYDWRAAVMPLAKTQKAAKLALAQTEGQLSRDYTPQEVAAATSVKPGAGALFTISVKAANANDAALLANALAAALPDVVADIYAGQTDAFDQALADVKQSFDAWDQRWHDFRAQNGIGLNFTGDLTSAEGDQLFGNQSAIKQELTIKSSDTAQLNILRENLATVRAALDAGDENIHLILLDTPTLSHYGLTFSALQQLPRKKLTQKLGALQAQVDSDAELMTADLLSLQTEVADILRTSENIQRTYNVWYDSMEALEGKQVELKVKRIVEGQRVQQVDIAQAPARPSQPNWPLNLALALVAGLLGGLFLAILNIYLGGAADHQT